MSGSREAAEQVREAKPPLLEGGHVLVVSEGYIAQSGGTVVMRNLLDQFDPTSYSVVTLAPPKGKDEVIAGLDPRVSVHAALDPLPWLKRGRRLLLRLNYPLALSWALRRARRTDPTVVVGATPMLFLSLARDIAYHLKRPWVAYLMDTIVENQQARWLVNRARRLQDHVLSEASSVLVVTHGLEDLFRSQYGAPAKCLPHCYAEPIPTDPTPGPLPPQALLGGRYYRINDRGLGRVVQAMDEVDVKVLLASSTTLEELASQYGIKSPNLRQTFYNRRADYLEALREQGLLVVTLNWPDEVRTEDDQLATAFPTRVVEYLASGKPILVHCPEHYYLTRFFREKRCGLVVSDRSVPALADGVRRCLDGGPEIDAMRRAALQAARLFSGAHLASLFRSEVEAAAKLQWSQRAQTSWAS